MKKEDKKYKYIQHIKYCTLLRLRNLILEES